MWHEARKQERLIRGLIVDYRRRAERRRDFYEKINADSTQILQVHGRPCKIHLEPAIAAAGDSASIMMPWQGDHNNIIDRFDVRAHLDYIPDIKAPDIPPENLSQEERNCNYERYRILAQNLFLNISEDKFLHQLSIEEQFGITMEEKELQKEKMNEKKGHGASIGYNYDDPSQSSSSDFKNVNKDDKDDSEEESENEILDVDLSIDVNKVEPSQAHAMNACGAHFGMMDTDLFSFLTGDAEEAERHRQQMREEKEKALFSGRKSRRQRRAHRDKLLATRIVSPPHYAARPSPTRNAGNESPSPTRSLSPPEVNTNIVTYITSFGDDDDQPATTGRSLNNKMSYADKARMNTETKTYASVLRDPKNTLKRMPSPKRSKRSPHSKVKRSRSKSRSRSRSRNSSRRSRSRRNSKPRTSRLKRSVSRSRSRDRHRSYSSSRSNSRDRWSSRSSYRSHSNDSRSSSSSSSSSRKGNNTKSQPKSSDTGHSLNVPIPPAPIVRTSRYYGRKREGCKSSSSELSVDSSDDQSNSTDRTNENMAGSKTSQVSNVVRSSGSASKQSAASASSDKLSFQEKLRRKMQAQLTRQLRADKKAEAERLEREQQMQQERDDEMREMAIKIRRRQREMRHQRRASYSSPDGNSSSSSSSSSSSRSRSPNYRKQSREREEKTTKKFNESPPRKIRSKIEEKSSDEDNSCEPEKDYASAKSERFSDKDRCTESKNQRDNEKPYDRSSSHGSKSLYNSRAVNDFKDRKHYEYKTKDSDERKHDRHFSDSKRRDADNSLSRHSKDGNGERESKLNKPPMRRLVDY